MTLKDRLIKQLDVRKQKHTLRRLSTPKVLIDFTSNDYLGLARSKELRNLIHTRSTETQWNGSTGSRLLSGNSEFTEAVEERLSKIFNSEKTLIFNSGYTANLAVLSTFPQRGDTILYDELSHACIKDGARLSLAKRHNFKHNDLTDLESKLKIASGSIFVAVESVYSMDGDMCPLKDLIILCEKYHANLILDEAHTTGLCGNNGNGLSCELQLEDRIFARIYTFGKAMGIHGAAVACSHLVADYIVNFARPFIYTTAPAPHSISSIDCAFSFISAHNTLQDDLKQRVNLFKNLYEKVVGSKLPKTESNHPIQAVIIPGNNVVKDASVYLRELGLDVRPILSPTVREGEERLRICLHTFNTDDEISLLINSLATLK